MCPVSLPTHFIKLLLCATVNKNLHRKISEKKRNVFDRAISMITDVALSSYLMSRAIQNQPWVGSELSLCCESSHLFQLEPGQDGPSSLQSVGWQGSSRNLVPNVYLLLTNIQLLDSWRRSQSQDSGANAWYLFCKNISILFH